MAAAAAINRIPTAEVTAEILPTGLFQVYRNGQAFGPRYHFADVAAGVVLSGRTYDPTSTYTLVDARTGQRLAADEAEYRALLLADHEPAEEPAPACEDCFSVEQTIKLSRGRVICPGCRAELETRIGPAVAA